MKRKYMDDNINDILNDLKKSIDKLETTLNENKIQIEYLTKENSNLNKKIIILEEKVIQLEMQNNKKHTYILFKKFIIAIQDINSRFQLESKINANESLKELKIMRNKDCHYLSHKYTQTDIRDRLYALNREISCMPKNVEILFDEQFPNLLNDIRSFLNTKIHEISDVKLTDESLNIINEWWQNIME